MSGKTKQEEEKPPKKTSLVIHIVTFLIVTGAAVGAGFGASVFLKAKDTHQTDAKMDDAELGEQHASTNKDTMVDGHSDEGDEKSGAQLTSAKLRYAKSLAPILTNLAAPSDVWVRLEVAILVEGSAEDELTEQIHQDLFAYMRTVKLHHVEGPSGYINLKAELKERAAIRSQGKVKDVLVRTLVFE